MENFSISSELVGKMRERSGIQQVSRLIVKIIFILPIMATIGYRYSGRQIIVNILIFFTLYVQAVSFVLTVRVVRLQ